jgi:hypothetical protein
VRRRLVVGLGLACAVSGAAVASATPSARATVITDPAADVRVEGAAGTDVIPDGHMDLRAVELGCHKSELMAHIAVGALSDLRTGDWRVTFRSGSSKLFVEAGAGAADVNVGDVHGLAGFRAGVVGSKGTVVTGKLDATASSVDIAAPLTVFGGAIRVGSTLESFQAASREVVLNAAEGRQIALADSATGSKSYAVSSC